MLQARPVTSLDQIDVHFEFLHESDQGMDSEIDALSKANVGLVEFRRKESNSSDYRSPRCISLFFFSKTLLDNFTAKFSVGAHQLWH